jgi:hypothetical protein
VTHAGVERLFETIEIDAPVDKVEHESRIAERTIEIDAPVDKVEHESRIAERTIEIDGCW